MMLRDNPLGLLVQGTKGWSLLGSRHDPVVSKFFFTPVPLNEEKTDEWTLDDP